MRYQTALRPDYTFDCSANAIEGCGFSCRIAAGQKRKMLFHFSGGSTEPAERCSGGMGNVWECFLYHVELKCIGAENGHYSANGEFNVTIKK
jgi:hypothetical protein